MDFTIQYNPQKEFVWILRTKLNVAHSDSHSIAWFITSLAKQV